MNDRSKGERHRSCNPDTNGEKHHRDTKLNMDQRACGVSETSPRELRFATSMEGGGDGFQGEKVTGRNMR